MAYYRRRTSQKRKYLRNFQSLLVIIYLRYCLSICLYLLLFYGFLITKKVWYYFDHAIFTLHYFSFLLIMILVLFFIDKLKPLLSMSPILGWVHFSLRTIRYFIYVLLFFSCPPSFLWR